MRILLLIFCVLVVANSLSAQVITQQKIQLDNNTIVVDSAGMQYPFVIWQKLVQTGEYSLKRAAKSDTFYLFQLSDKQKQMRKEMALKTRPPESKSFTTGEKFIPFKTTDIANNKINIKDLQSKIIVINFWFINCPPCRAEIPELNKLVDRFKDNKDVVFLAIATDDRSDLKDFLKTSPYNYDIIDGGRWIAEKYRVNSFPTHVIIDQQGSIRFHTTGLGAGTVPWIEKTINELLQKNTASAAMTTN